MTQTSDIIAARAQTHGDFANTARIAQRLKAVKMQELYTRNERGQLPLSPAEEEALDLILTKIARIISGESSLPEHWLDIAGYADIALSR